MALLPAGALRRATKLGTEARKTRDSFEASVVDDTAPITRAAQQHRPKDAGRIEAVVTTNTRGAAMNKSARVFDLGILPGAHGTRIAPLNTMMKAVRSLDETEQQDLRNAFDAQNSIQQAQRDPTMDKSDMSIWLQQVQRAEANPRLRNVMGAWENVRTGVAKYLHDEGYISDGDYVDFAGRKGYVPTIYKGQESDNVTARLFNRAVKGSTAPREDLNPSIRKRRPAEDTAMMRSEREKLDVFESMFRYVDDAVRYTGENTARREFMDAMLQGTDAFGPVRKLDKVSQSDHNVIQVRRNGQTERYSVSDNKLYNALKFDNHFVIPAANEMRKFSQWTTTGTWAFPFAPTSLMYDTGFALVGARSKKMVTGHIDSYLAMNGVNATARDLVAPITRMVDMGVVNVASGIYHGVVGKRTEEMTRQALNYAMDAGLYDPKMTPATRKQIEDGLSQAYRRYNETVYGQIAHRGHTVSTFSDDTVQTGAFERHLLGRLERSKKYRGFAGAIENIKEAQRMALFARNVAHMEKKLGRTLNDVEYDKIATEVRNVAADPTKLGNSKIVTGAMSTSPYGNVVLQSTYHLMRQGNNVAAWSTLFWLSAGQLAIRHWIESNTDEGVYNEKLEQSPTYQRVTGILVPKPTAILNDKWEPDDLVWMNIGPELGLIGSIGAQVINTMYDAVSGEESPEGPGAVADAGAAIANLMNFATPPIVNWATAAFGEGQVDLAGAFFKERNPQMPPIKGSNPLLPEQRAHGLSSGWVGERAAALMHMAFGMHGATITDTLELSLDREYNNLENQSFFEGARKAWGVAWNNTLGRENVVAPLFPGSVVQRDSKGTPLSQRFYTIKSSLNDLITEERIIRGNGVLGNISNPIHVPDGAMLIPRIRDPQLKQQLMQVVMHFKNPARERHLEAISKLDRQINLYKGNLSMSRTAANMVYNDHVGAIQQRQRAVLDDYNSFEARMQERYGPEWSLETFTRAIKEDLRMGHAPRE